MLNLPRNVDSHAPPRHVVSRFSIAILASLLCGASCGRVLAPEVATMCGFTGLAGFVGYLALHLSARTRWRQRNETLKTSAEYRLLAHAVSALVPPTAPDRPSPRRGPMPSLITR